MNRIKAVNTDALLFTAFTAFTASVLVTAD